MRNSVVVSVAFGMAASAFAADVYFPDADGSHDLSSPAAWNVATADDFKDNRAVITNNVTLTALKDFTLAGILVNNPTEAWRGIRQSVTFDMRNETTGATDAPRKISLTAAFVLGYNRHDVTFRGGEWDLNGKTFNAPKEWGVTSNVVALTDGAVIKNCGELRGGAYGGDSHFSMGGASRVYAKTMRVGYYGDTRRSTFDVREGSQITLADGGKASDAVLYSDFSSNGSVEGNRLTVSGANSKLAVTVGSVVCGYSSPNNESVIEDGGSMVLSNGNFSIGTDGNGVKASNNVVRVGTDGLLDVAGDLTLGGATVGNRLAVDGGEAIVRSTYWQKSASNAVEVSRGGTLRLLKTVYLGANGPGNRIVVGENGTLETGAIYYGGYVGTIGTMGMPGNEVVVSNGVFKGPMPYLGYGYLSSNSVLRLIGAKTRFGVTTTGVCELFFNAPYGLVSVDGASWTNDVSAKVCFSDGRLQHDCRLEIVNGGELVVSNDFGIALLTYPTSNNTVYVGCDSRLEAKTVSINSSHNTMIVSNGTAVARTGNFSVTPDHAYIVHTNGCLVLQGTRPSVAATNGTVTVYKGSKIRFELPAGPYDGDIVPIVAKNVTLDKTSSLEFANVATYVENLPTRVSKTLVRVTGELNVSDAQIAAANERLLPHRARLAKSADGKELVLRAGRGGLTVFVK